MKVEREREIIRIPLLVVSVVKEGLWKSITRIHSPFPEENMSSVASIAATIDRLEARSDVLTSFFMHVCSCPPHGPFSHLSALTLVAELQQQHGLHITPAVAEAWLRRYFNVDHLRGWPSFYVPSDVSLEDAQRLMGLKSES